MWLPTNDACEKQCGLSNLFVVYVIDFIRNKTIATIIYRI